VFTGGEPTIDRNLPEYLRICAAAGVPEISVYTNGMALSSLAYTRRLADAGANLFLISLHSRHAGTSDAITRTPGGFDKTVRGISNAISTGALVVLNYVINTMNFRETPAFVSFAADRFPGAVINFSYVAPILDAAADMSVVPKFRDAAPHIIKALDEAARLGADATGLEPHRGIPPCALNADERYFPFLPPLTELFTGFIKPAACKRCRLDSSCPGVRKNYAALHGLDELRPLR